MDMSEKYSLKWNEFQRSVCGSFRYVREDEDFCDVTLVSDDDKHVRANKIILAASSTVFKNIIKATKNPYPTIFLRGFKSWYLEYLLDFMYLGEVQVPNQDLKEFLDSAEDLKINGLTEKSLEEMNKGNNSGEQMNESSTKGMDDDVIEVVDSEAAISRFKGYIEEPSLGTVTTNLKAQNPIKYTEPFLNQKDAFNANKHLNAGNVQKVILKPVLSENNRVTLKRAIVLQNPDTKNKAVQLQSEPRLKMEYQETPLAFQQASPPPPPVQFANIQSELSLLEHFEQFESQQMKKPIIPSNTLSELDVNTEAQDDTILKMFSRKQSTGYTCKSCGEFSNHKLIMKRHIQRNHMTDMQHSCKICGKLFSSRNRLSSHMTTMHQGQE